MKLHDALGQAQGRLRNWQLRSLAKQMTAAVCHVAPDKGGVSRGGKGGLFFGEESHGLFNQKMGGFRCFII